MFFCKDCKMCLAKSTTFFTKSTAFLKITDRSSNDLSSSSYQLNLANSNRAKL